MNGIIYGLVPERHIIITIKISAEVEIKISWLPSCIALEAV